MSKRILVTGGAGFIGSHLVDALIARGEEVGVLDDLSSGKREYLNPKAKFFELDIRTDAAKEAIREFKPEVIFHLAAQKSVPDSLKHPKIDADINIVGLCNLLEALPGLGLKRFIFASTGGAMYGDNAKLPASEEMPAQPSSPYGLAKYITERYLQLWSELHGFSVTSLRFANVFGPRQDPYGEAGVIAIFAKRAVSNQPMRVFGTGLHTRDYVYISDIVDSLTKSLDIEVSGIFNIGTGKETSVMEIIQNLSKVVGRDLPVDYQPEVVGEMERSALDAGKATAELRWQPSIDIQAGINQTYKWFSQVN